MEENDSKFEKIEVDMDAYLTDEAKSLRSKIRACESQMEYLAFRHNLYADKKNAFVKEYNILLGLEKKDGEPIQQK